MALIIDGHNLIGALPDIQLGDPDDEVSLLARLRVYRARAAGQQLVVFFDSGDLPSAFPDQSSPGVEVRFSRPGQSADDAILEFLKGQAQPGQYAVVTNDLELAHRARMAGASTLAATTFAHRLAHRRRPSSPTPPPGPHPHDPAYADIYESFLDAEKRRPWRESVPREDPAPWIEKLYDGDSAQAQAAARWLGLNGRDQALPALRDALTHTDPAVRAAALLALGELGDPAGLPDLAARLLNDQAGLVREAAAQSLGRIGNRSVEAALETAIASDTKSKVRRAAQAALDQIRARRRP